MTPPDSIAGAAVNGATPGAAPQTPPGMSSGLVFVFALACGALVANIYYAQSLVGPISAALDLHEGFAGLIVTLTQLGYGAGLLLLVSLADLVENRRLVLLTMGGTIVGLLGVGLSTSAATFLAASFLVGFCSVSAQVLVPFAAHLSPENRRGQVIGNIMGGLLAGIMLARPLSSIVADLLGWRAIFFISAGFMVGLTVILHRTLPRRAPRPGMHYGQILFSILELFARFPALRRRAAYQGLVFAGFNLFWTAIPLMLGSRFGFTQRGIAAFALAGAGGALAAPLAGRLADRGLTRPASALSYVAMIAAFLVSAWAAGPAGALLVLVVAAIVLDAAAQVNQVVSQRVVYGLSAEARGRLNAAYMTVVFLCGAAGSSLGSITVFWGGWLATALTGAALGVAVLLLFLTELRPARR